MSKTGSRFAEVVRLSERFQRLIALLAPVEDLGVVAKTITGCIDGRGHVLDMASPELAQIRQKLADVDDFPTDPVLGGLGEHPFRGGDGRVIRPGEVGGEHRVEVGGSQGREAILRRLSEDPEAGRRRHVLRQSGNRRRPVG